MRREYYFFVIACCTSCVIFVHHLKLGPFNWPIKPIAPLAKHLPSWVNGEQEDKIPAVNSSLSKRRGIFDGLYNYTSATYQYFKKTSLKEYCAKGGHIISGGGGRMGNHMHFYLALVMLQKHLGIRAVISKRLYNSLKNILGNILLSPMSPECSPRLHARKKDLDSKYLLVHGKSAISAIQEKDSHPLRINVEGYGISSIVIRNYSREAHKLITLNSRLEAEVHRFYEDKQISVQDTLIIGVHVRRTDYLPRLRKLCKEHVTVSANWYFRAYNKLKVMMNATKVVVLVGSDDPKWCKEHFSSAWNVHFLEDYHHSVSKGVRLSAFDMAALGSANASIISNGSYGRWCAFFSRGPTIYPTYKCTARNPAHGTKGLGNYRPDMTHWHNLSMDAPP